MWSLYAKGTTELLALPVEITKDVEQISRNPKKLVKIRTGLGEPLLNGLIDLWVYANIFTWSPSDMFGIDESVAVHQLSIDSPKNMFHRR